MFVDCGFLSATVEFVHSYIAVLSPMYIYLLVQLFVNIYAKHVNTCIYRYRVN